MLAPFRCPGWRLLAVAAGLGFAVSLAAQTATSRLPQEPAQRAADGEPPPRVDPDALRAEHEPDAMAVVLARRIVKGGDDARAALREAALRMGWEVRDERGALLQPAPAGAATGLALRDHEIVLLCDRPAEQAAVRLIVVAQALAVPLEGADPEGLAQGFVDALREGAEHANPQRRFWARLVIALGLVSADGYDLTVPGAPVLQPSAAELADFQQRMVNVMQSMNAGGAIDVMAMRRLAEMQRQAPPMLRPVWATDDPVLAPSPWPGEDTPNLAAQDEERMEELSAQSVEVYAALAAVRSEGERQALERRLEALRREQDFIQQRQVLRSAAAADASRRALAAATGERDDEEDDDEDNSDRSGPKPGDRFLAEHRDVPLSMLQVLLLARPFAADLLAAGGGVPRASHGPPARVIAQASILPLAWLRIAQAPVQPTGGPPTTGAGMVAASGLDAWATGWGQYTSKVLEKNMPDNKFNKAVGAANLIMGWVKTLIMIARSEITLRIDNPPLVRTKTRAPGEPRTVHCRVELDFPKTPDLLKAARALLNLTSIDLQIPEGGPVSGAKVVWRLPEGSRGDKYETAQGGWSYRPDLAVVQFAEAGGPAAYISYTDDDGETSITVEGAPQRRDLPATVRPMERRAAVAVEVTMKVGNFLQDVTDAIGAAGLEGAPGISGVATLLSEMVQRTSLFFRKGLPFPVRDWVPPAWEGKFVITVRGAGSKTEKGEKGGPPVRYEWSMDRAMGAKLATPEWDQETADDWERAYDGRSRLEVTGDTTAFKVADQSQQVSRNVEAVFTAEGPVQVGTTAELKLPILSRAEPSGSAILTTWADTRKYELRINPFFVARVLEFHYERSRGRSRTESGVRSYSLLQGVDSPREFVGIGEWDPATGEISGTRTYEGRGSLPHVPNFDTVVEFGWELKYNAPPPPPARR